MENTAQIKPVNKKIGYQSNASIAQKYSVLIIHQSSLINAHSIKKNIKKYMFAHFAIKLFLSIQLSQLMKTLVSMKQSIANKIFKQMYTFTQPVLELIAMPN